MALGDTVSSPLFASAAEILTIPSRTLPPESPVSRRSAVSASSKVYRPDKGATRIFSAMSYGKSSCTSVWRASVSSASASDDSRIRISNTATPCWAAASGCAAIPPKTRTLESTAAPSQFCFFPPAWRDSLPWEFSAGLVIHDRRVMEILHGNFCRREIFFARGSCAVR